MHVYDMIYAVLDANDNKIRGGTTLQKIIYLASKKITDLGVPPYKAHYYGPFSPGLSWALEKMVLNCFLYENNIPGYEGYEYGLTDDGREISRIVKKREKDKFEEIAEIVNMCKKFCKLKATPLSYASKIHYLLDSHETDDKMSFSDAVDYAKELRWQASKDDVKHGVKLLEKLELTTVSR